VTAFSAGRDAVLPFPVVQAHQVHGDKIAYVGTPSLTREDLEGIDALLTDVPGCAIGARSADCVPILLFDTTHRAAAAVHAGWKGTALAITSKAVRAMSERFGTNPVDVRAVIGPSIGSDSFQVGEEVVARFRQAGFPMDLVHSYRGPRREGTMQGGHHIDLWAANRWLLTSCGVPDEQIHTAGICTYLHNDLFYSARREGVSCPRIINAIRIEP